MTQESRYKSHGGRDKKIKTSKAQRDELTVLGLLDEGIAKNEPIEQQSHPRAILNERYCGGEQFVELENNQLTDALWGDNIPKVALNYTRNNVLSFAARLLEDRPDVKAWPSDPSRYDRVATFMANAIIGYQHERLSVDAKMMEAAYLAQLHSCIGMKVTWDPDAGPFIKQPAIDEFGYPVIGQDGQQMMENSDEHAGDVRWDLVTIFNFITDGAEHVQHSQYAFFRRHMDFYEAKMLCMEAGITDDPGLEEFDNVWGAPIKGVEVWEIWHKPGARIPNGLYAVVVGGHVVSMEDFPYDHGQLPVSVWKIGNRSDHPHGITHVDDAVQIQKGINESISIARSMRRRVGENVKLLAPSSVVEAWESDDQLIKIDDAELLRAIKWLTPPTEAMTALVNDVDKDREFLFDVFGLNEMTTGVESLKSGTAGKSIAYVKQLDSQKLAMAARNLGEMLKRCWGQTLRLTQQFVQQERLVEIAGKGSQFAAIAFKGSDIGGVDVRIEPSSGQERFKAAKSKVVDEAVQLGYMPPQEGAELRESGLDSTGSEADARSRAQELIEEVVAGKPPQFDGSVPPPVMIEEIQTAIEIKPQAQQALMMLEADVRRFQQEQQQAQRQMTQGQPQPQQGQRRPPPRPAPAPVMKQQPPLPKGSSFQ